MARDQHRVDRLFRPRAVRTAPGDVDVEERAARHHRTWADRELADRQARRVVHPEYAVTGETLEQAILKHRQRAADAFLGRLEDEIDGAVEALRFGEIARGAEQHRRMPVVATGVHHTGLRRLVGDVDDLLDRQRIHIAAQPDRWAVARLQDTHDARLADVAMDRDAEFGELLRDEIAGAMLVETKLGVGMNIAPPDGEIVVIGLDLIGNIHRPLSLSR